MSAFINNPMEMINGNININLPSCRLYKSFLPTFAPLINNISVTSSVAGQYSLVYITGRNFLSNGITYVNFGPYTNIPICYYSSFNISFVIPLNLPAGDYNVVVVNIYNGQFSAQVKNSYPGNLNYSNPILYTLT